MIFLQHVILWGLPLALLPVIIHLLNRLRYRTVAWGAMLFLRRASRQSTRYARVRQWLLLACRCLALLCLIVALSRPLVGGWLGSAMGGPPDTVIILFDRSASMGTHLEGANDTRAAYAANLLADAAAATRAARWVFIDNVSLEPRELTDADQLRLPALTSATESGADLPALFEHALRYLQANRTGTTELWIASDLQRSSWAGSGDRWEMLRTRLESLPQPLRLRLLALDEPSPANASVRVLEAATFRHAGARFLHLTIHLQGDRLAGREVPLRLELNGVDSGLTVTPAASEMVMQHVIALGDTSDGGWGRVALPADANLHDNNAWFTWQREVTRRTLIVHADTQAGERLRLAAAPLPEPEIWRVDTLPPEQLTTAALSDVALLILQGVQFEPEQQAAVTQWVEDGGICLIFPGEDDTGRILDGLTWGALELALPDAPFAVSDVVSEDGPLRPAVTGEVLPLDELRVFRRRQPTTIGEVLAQYVDGSPLFLSHQLGRGEMVLCTTLPQPSWSELGRGPILVPVVQRLLARGSRRLGDVAEGSVGQAEIRRYPGNWTRIAGTAADPATSAGIYEVGTTRIALNRPISEDDPDQLDKAEARALFGNLSIQIFTETDAADRSLQSEIWRAFLVGMLLFLVGESLLSLPATERRRSGGGSV